MTATETFEFEVAVAMITSAPNPQAIFGDGDGDEWHAEAQATYRRLARVVHPDAKNGPEDEASAAFVKLGELWERAQLKAGVIDTFTLTTKRRTYSVTGTVAQGDIATLYGMTYPDVFGVEHGIIKMPRDPRNNDLIQAEAKSLKALVTTDPEWWPYFPRLIESFRHKDTSTNVMRRVNALTDVEGLVSLADVRAAYPDGLNPRDLAWMWRRLFVVLGLAQQVGVVHGAVTPDHILIQPDQHGLVLVDWCYSVETGAKVPAISPYWRDLYAPEILAKEPVDASTDLFMASKTMLWMLGPNPPTQFAAFVKGTALQAKSRRPQDPWELQREFDELIDRLFGPRKFRPFSMPDPTEGK